MVNRREAIMGLSAATLARPAQLPRHWSGKVPLSCIEAARPHIVTAANQIYNRHVNMRSISNASVAFRVMAAQINEAGAFAYVDDQIRAGAVIQPTQEQLDAVFAAMHTSGLRVDRQTVEGLFTGKWNDAKAIMEKCGGGIHVAELGADILDAVADHAAVAEAGEFIKVQSLHPSPHTGFCYDNFSWYSGAASAYFGIVALAITGPVGVGIGLGAAVIGLASLYTSC